MDTIRKIDWALLAEQKLALVYLTETAKTTPEEVDALLGVIHLLDALQDEFGANPEDVFSLGRSLAPQVSGLRTPRFSN